MIVMMMMMMVIVMMMMMVIVMMMVMVIVMMMMMMMMMMKETVLEQEYCPSNEPNSFVINHKQVRFPLALIKRWGDSFVFLGRERGLGMVLVLGY